MAKELKAAALANYGGHSIKNNKAVDLTLKFKYEELPNYIKLIQFLNENTTIKVKKGDNDPVSLGTFMVKEIKIDHDGEGIVKFNSMMDYVEAGNITMLVGDEVFRVRFEASTDATDESDDE